MIVLTASIYVIGLLFYIISGVTVRALSRKMKNIGDFFVNNIGFTLMIFCTPNMITALCIEIKENSFIDTSLVWSKGLMIISIILILVGNIKNCLNLS